jgi:beta-1,4-mannosyl-glycoprotein beta-1,4-N-acetylglucosaminyltransferase
MRQKVRIKNLKYNFYRFDKEKSIEIFDNGGWHFNNILEPEDISIKLKTFAHTEFLENKFSSIEIIKKKIDNKIDLFERGHVYKKIELDNSFPKYLIENKELYKKFIL